MATEMPINEMWTLASDQKSVRMQIPPLQFAKRPLKPVRINLDFDAAMVDAILQRLTSLRSQMVPPPVVN